jgi:predicted secreted hydrolase
MNSITQRKPNLSNWLRLALAAILIVLLGGLGWQAWNARTDPALNAQLILPESSTARTSDIQGFTRADGSQSVEFPADFGAHPDYQTEWWYYTGNLADPNGNHFGYQLTFFRRALIPPTQQSERSSSFAADQAYMAHFALTSVANNRHDYSERLSRGAAGLAEARGTDYRVWLEDWYVEQIDQGLYRLYADAGEFQVDLELKDLKGPILQGQAGYSQKGTDPGNASYYYSQTRLETTGTVTTGEQVFPVTGLSWKDHEYSTSALSEDQIGWDWFSIQLDDLHEVMVFQIRRADGSIDDFSSGTLILPDGVTRRLSKDAFQIEVLDTWTSPDTGAVYPAQWKISIPSEQLSLEVIPFVADQELNLTYNYWEGAVSVQGTHAGAPVQGSGYVELTGYAGSMSGEF